MPVERVCLREVQVELNGLAGLSLGAGPVPVRPRFHVGEPEVRLGRRAVGHHGTLRRRSHLRAPLARRHEAHLLAHRPYVGQARVRECVVRVLGGVQICGSARAHVLESLEPDDVSKRSLRLLEPKLRALAEQAEFGVNINSVVGGASGTPRMRW
jgi:hypothetical protein